MVRPEIKKKLREKAASLARSRKDRKKLEKIVLHKKQKVNRTKLLAELKKCQLQESQLQLLHSTSSMQTKGLKRFISDDNNYSNTPKLDDIGRAEQCLDAAILLKRRKGRKRKKVATELVSSSSEDTDDVSTDTEVYWDSPKRVEEVEEKVEEEVKISIEQNGTSVKPVAAEPVVLEPCQPEAEKVPKKLEPAIYIPVFRDPAVEKSRLELPIIGEEQNIMETIRYNDIVIISGETGSGKTTQIPQFLYEAGYALNRCLIGITEPRRVAAVSMSERVAKELNLTPEEVSYQIRFSGNVSDRTKIKFMTDGVLLRECQQDFLLSKYSVIIIDEAHERSVFSDILIGLLSRIVPMRAKRNNPLKLVIMSATLRLSDFTENSFLFRKPPPSINIETRQFPVTVKFARRTPTNYLQAAYQKVCSVHSKLPKGGILVFVTSQMDVKVLCRKLREKFPKEQKSLKRKKHIKRRLQNSSRRHCDDENSFDFSDSRSTIENVKEGFEFVSEEEVDDSNDKAKFYRGSSDLLEWSEADSDSEDEGTISSSKTPLHCLGLYAMLPLEKQRLVFKEPPEGTRLCVVATNVAETSITIPNIKYVIDTGMEKTKVYDLVTGVSRFITTWTSKSSAEQRMGRAGRMGPGHCFRLYSSAVFTDSLPDHAEPRILQKPVEDIILQMKAMSIDNVVNFPFPTRPSIEALKAAEKKLIMLGALDDSKAKVARFADINKTKYSSRLTKLGKAMARFAISARCSKMVVLSPTHLLPHVISLVSALTVREMFLEGSKWRDIKKKWLGHGNSKKLGDFMLMIRAVIAADSFECSNKSCLENGIRTKAMLEIDKLRKQLTQEVNNNLTKPVLKANQKLTKPTEEQSKIIRELLLSSYCDHVARKLPDGFVIEKSSSDPNKTEKKKLKNAYECTETDQPVYISSESILKGQHPDFVIYKELYQGDKRMYMRDVAVIEHDWLSQYESKLTGPRISSIIL